MSKRSFNLAWILIPVALLVLVAAVVGFRNNQRLARIASLWTRPTTQVNHDVDGDGEHDHDGAHPPDHEHADDHAHEVGTAIELSENGLKNIGFEPLVVELTGYDRTLTLPSVVVERPGRSQIHITAPLAGIVTKIHAVTGQAVDSGEPLFDLRLTHEELVAAQRDFLETTANLGIVEREIQRLRELGEGVIAGKRILEQEYEKQKLEVALLAAQQAMLLHGLTDEQIDQIRQTRKLFRTITIETPEHTDTDESCEGPHLFTLQRLAVAPGEHVDLGQELAVIADHCELHIEALAFEDDAARIRHAAEAGRPVTARLLEATSSATFLRDLEILYVASQIDRESRAFKVYVGLPNKIALDKTTPDGKRFIEWVYKPGQRMQLNIPFETWEDQLVLPPTAVVDEGAEAYVYRRDGQHFDQVSVHVLHRDPNAIVVANDGTLKTGDTIAAKGAYQIHLALKNQQGGGLDPHAGHSH